MTRSWIRLASVVQRMGVSGFKSPLKAPALYSFAPHP